MPTYEYMCNNCKHQWEVNQSVKDSPIKECPKCKELRAKRLISSTSFQLKGTGWFKSGGY